MKNQQTAIHDIDPLTAKQQWLEAMEAHKIAGLRVQRCEDDVERWESEIRAANENQPISGEARDNMATLCVELTQCMKALEAAEREKAAKSRSLQVAWKTWLPFATAKAQEVPRLGRIGVLARESRRVMEGAPTSPRIRVAERPVADHATVKKRQDARAAETQQ